MKRLTLLFFSLLWAQLLANMANPVWNGTLGGRPFVSQYVDVVHEDLYVTLDKDFKGAQFKARYHINASMSGFQIPFLFYASEFLEAFVVTIDGEEVETSPIPYDFKVPEGTKFKDFSYFFEKPSWSESSQVLIKNDSMSGFHVSLHDMLYFECDITKGEHVIEVSYKATQWVDNWDWVRQYSFRYALSPAKYWKSFGTLKVYVDATAFKGKLGSNLGKPLQGSLDVKAFWSFDHLPVEVMQITYNPEIGSLAKVLIKVGPGPIGLIIGLLLAFIHLIYVRRYREKWPMNKYAPVVSWGSVLVPMLFLMCWVGCYDLIDLCIGEHASGRHGYTFFTYFLYPVILPFYWLVFWQIDRAIKRRVISNDKRTSA